MTINPLLSTASATQSSAAQVVAPKQTLDQGDFLRLLVTQMTSQNPLDPMKDTAFIAQMAQFSALEQSKSMQADIAALRADQQMVQANALLGRTVILNLDGNTQTSGLVSAVQMVAGTPKIVVNGQSYDLSQLSAISQTVTTN